MESQELAQSLATLTLGSSRFVLTPTMISGHNVQFISSGQKSRGNQSFPLMNVASTTVMRSTDVWRIIAGIVLAVIAIVMLSHVGDGGATPLISFLVFGALAFFAIRSALGAYFEVVNNAGQRMLAGVVRSSIPQVESFIQQVNEAISTLHRRD